MSAGIGSPQSPNRAILEREGKKTLLICVTILLTSLLAHFIFYPHESPFTSHEHETDLNIEMNDSVSTASSSSSFDDHDHFSQFHSRPLLPPVFCPSPVPYACHPHWKQPQLMFGFEAEAAMDFSSSPSASPEFGIRVAIAMRDRCCRYENENEEFASFFRVLIQSDEVRTASEVGLTIDLNNIATGTGGAKGEQTNGRKEESPFGFERTVTTFVRLPESGTYTVRVLLMLYNISSHLIDTNYEMNAILPEESQGQWINKPIYSLVSFDSSMNITLTSRSSSVSSFTASSSLPLCGSLSLSSGSPYLPGRWLLGPWRDPTPYRQGWMSNSQNLFDEYQLAQWVPLDCRLDEINDWQAIARRTIPQELKSITAAVGESSSQMMVEVLSNLQWIHIVGDSNARHLFMTMCEMITGAVMHSAPQNVQSNDPPFSCTAPGSMDKSQSEWVITYTNWFVHKHWPLPDETTTFGEQCSKYSDQPSAETGGYEGWPGCSVVSPSVSHLSGPGLTYFVWGSHAAEWGATEATEEYFQEMLSKPYFSVNPTLFALTTACDSDLIPAKFGKQFLYRNNERIDAVNRLLIRKVKERIDSKEWKWMEETMEKGAEEEIEQLVSAVDGDGKVMINGYGSKLNSVEKWLPLLDVFSPTYAVYERLSGDPVHFWSQTQQRIALLLMHYAKHAPNWRRKQV